MTLEQIRLETQVWAAAYAAGLSSSGCRSMEEWANGAVAAWRENYADALNEAESAAPRAVPAGVK